MAYTPTEWETGDIITAEKLNNIEDGIVANEEAIAETQSKDILVITGDLTADLSFNATFTLTSGDVTKATEYKDIIIKVHLYYDMGGDNPVDSYYDYIMHLSNINYSSEDPTEVLYLDFTSITSIQQTFYEVYLQYLVSDGTWNASFTPIAA